MKTVVLFQGGGPLGAFGCGAWQVLAPWLSAQGHAVVALGGTSIGAFNAAVLRRHLEAPDGGAGELTRIWTDRIAAPSLPFLGMPLGKTPWETELRSWNGLLTGLLAGNGLYAPNLAAWSPWGLLDRARAPLLDRGRMWRLMEAEIPPYRSAGADDVLLFAASSDVETGALVLHDSDNVEMGPQQVGASSAIPVLFDPVTVDGRMQWDGELVRQSPIGPVLQRLRDSGRAGAREPVQVITVEQQPHVPARLPRSGPELIYRAVNLSQIGKLVPRDLPGVQWLAVTREAHASDGVSGMFDHSVERIALLIESGRQAAEAALAGTSDGRPPAPRRARRTPAAA